MKGKDWRLVWAVGAAVVSGCGGGTRIVTVVNSDADGSSEYWVCDHKARDCRGEREGDLDPKGFQHRMRVVAPPAECPDGVHRMDIVVDRTEVVRVRYECAHGDLPTGLPGRPAVPPDGEPTELPPDPPPEPGGAESEGDNADPPADTATES